MLSSELLVDVFVSSFCTVWSKMALFTWLYSFCRRYTLPLHSVNRHAVICATSLHSSQVLQVLKNPGLLLILTRAWSLLHHSSIALSTMLCDNPFHCLRPWTGIWYTRYCIMPHVRQSAGSRSGLFGCYEPAGINLRVIRWSCSVI